MPSLISTGDIITVHVAPSACSSRNTNVLISVPLIFHFILQN